jgi:UDP-perosamine 4-acetyltransferase
VIEAARAQGVYRPSLVLTPDADLGGGELFGVPVAGGDELLSEAVARFDCSHGIVAVGSLGRPELRWRLWEMLCEHRIHGATIVHPSAVVSPTARLADGVVVMPLAVVHTGARVGADGIVNTGAIVEHDCLLGDHVHIAPGACLGGGCRVGSGAHVGLGACVREGICIGDRALVAAGAVVVRDVPAGTRVMGVPARPCR